MKIYIGEIQTAKGKKKVYVSDEIKLGKNDSKDIILTKNDMDEKWIKNVFDTADYTDHNCVKCNGENKQYILLYILLSTKYRLYYSDVIEFMNHEEICRRSDGTGNLHTLLYDDLLKYISEHGYSYVRMKGNVYLINRRPFIPFRKYSLNENLSYAGIRSIFLTLIQIIRQISFLMLQKIIKKISVHTRKYELKKRYGDVKIVKTESFSGNLFFTAENNIGDKIFIKCSPLFVFNNAYEYKATGIMSSLHSNKRLYLLPHLQESNEKILVYDYSDKHITLGDVLSKRKLTEIEQNLLLIFIREIIDDLSEHNVIHRDIHPGNIILEMDDEDKIRSFKLIDFGCSCINQEVNNNTFIEKWTNRYSGNNFRKSINSWDDSISAVYLYLQVAREVTENNMNELMKILEKKYSVELR